MRAAVEEYVNQKLIELNLHIDSAVDRDYAIGYYKGQQIKFDSIFNDNRNPASQYVYHKYLMGEDVEMIIKSEKFYRIFYNGDDLFFQKVVAHGNIDSDKVNVELVAKMNEGDNLDIEIPPFGNYQFCLSDELYEEIYTDTFNFISFNEILRAIKKHLENYDLNDKPNPIVPNSLLKNDNSDNLFNGVPINLVRSFFNQLCDEKYRVLESNELNDFISRGFQGDSSIKKQTLNTAHTKKTVIVKLFHLFYQECTANSKFEFRKNCIEKYKRLLTDNFTNWDQKGEVTNFSRNTAHKWGKKILG